MTFDEEKRDSAKAPSTVRSTNKDSDLHHDCGSSICSIDESSSITAFGSVLAPLHEFEYRDVKEEEKEIQKRLELEKLDQKRARLKKQRDCMNYEP